MKEVRCLNKVLCDNIKTLLAIQGETVSGLEQKLGYGRGTISKWENANPCLSRVLGVAEYFGVTADALVHLPMSPERLQHEYIASTLVFLLVHDKIQPTFEENSFTCAVGKFSIQYTYEEDEVVVTSDESERHIPLYDADKSTLCTWVRKEHGDPVLNELREELRLLMSN